MATDFLLALTNFKAQTIDADVKKIEGFAVGDFASQADQVFGPTFFQQVQKAKVISVGKVRSLFVQSIEGSNASVFGVVDETFKNASTSGTTQVVRFNVTMIETKDGWKISGVELLQSPGPTPFGG